MPAILRLPAAAAAFVTLAGGQASAQTPLPHPGQAVYRERCAACHDNPEAARAPAKATLSAMSYQALNYALTLGKMKAQGEGLDDEARGRLINYLTGRSTVTLDTWSAPMRCEGARAKVDLRSPPSVATFGFDARQTRTLSPRQTGLTKAKLSKMELAWSLGFPDVTMIRSQAAVVGNNLFLPVAEAAAVYSLDISDPSKPCVQWVYNTPGGAPLRTSAAYGVIADGTPVLAFSGLDSTVHALDARTGKPLWTRNVGVYSYSLTTGTPRVLKDRIVVPVSQYEIMEAANNAVTCCTNHGYVVSLDPKTGAQQWRYDTMEDARPVRDRGDGKPLMGPSGAPIWNSPVVDERRGLIFFGTGESNSPPAHRNTDALIAIRLKDGTEAWSHQATENDIFNAGCGPNPKPTQLNCVKETVYRDVDFGASLILAKLSGGREVLLAGQKWARSGRSTLTRARCSGGATSARGRPTAASTGASPSTGTRSTCRWPRSAGPCPAASRSTRPCSPASTPSTPGRARSAGNTRPSLTAPASGARRRRAANGSTASRARPR
jgi:polyvinyl alcohol dehydrogenase (cytochrome)